MAVAAGLYRLYWLSCGTTGSHPHGRAVLVVPVCRHHGARACSTGSSPHPRGAGCGGVGWRLSAAAAASSTGRGLWLEVAVPEAWRQPCHTPV